MKNLFKALSNFQKKVPIIHKGTEGYGYTFASLSQIIEVITPILEEVGIGFTQLPLGTTLKTIIFHVESGETLESEIDIPQGVKLSKQNEFQVLGSSITYMRRYALSSMLGLVTDKDTDGNTPEQKGNTNTPKANPTTKEDNREWFNPTTKDGKLTVQANNYIAYAKKTSLNEAYDLTVKQYKTSEPTRQWMKSVDLSN